MRNQKICVYAVACLATGAMLPSHAGAQTIGAGSTTSIGSGVQSGNNASPDATRLRATEGDSTINSSNVDALSRSGNIGTSATTSFGSDSSTTSGTDFSIQLGPNPGAMPRLPSPRVGIDLSAIRSGLEAAPSATPDSAGN